MTTPKIELPVTRKGWTGHKPVISGDSSSAAIFQLASRSGGASIEEMLRLRVDSGKPYDTKKKAVVKLLKEISKAYCIELIGIGDKFQFQPENSLVSRTNDASQQKSDQHPDYAYLPSKEDFESAYRMLTRPGETISIDSVLDQIYCNAMKNGLSLKNNWRLITEKNIEIWSKKR